jgi:elongation factor Ts
MITTELIKTLRDKTGVSVMQCKKALEEAGGDMEKATIILLKRSAEAAVKKGARELGAGVVESYIHSTRNVGSLVEVMCETDFVSNNEEFKKLAYDVAMQVVATSPEFLKREDVTEESKAKAREVFLKEINDVPVNANKSDDMKEKILAGKLDAYFNERVLMEQAFIKNPDMIIRNLVEQAVQKFGEKIEITRFIRYSVK